MFEYHLEHIFSYNATLDPKYELIGPTPEGLKINIYVTPRLPLAQQDSLRGNRPGIL